MIRGKEVLPPPVIARTGQKRPPPPPPPKSGKAIPAGPPLPPRKTAAAAAASSPVVPPALPPRTSSDYGRTSSEYTPSSASISSNSSVSDCKPDVYRVRAPAWGQTELPAVKGWNSGPKDTKDTSHERQKGESQSKPSFDARSLNGNVAALRNQLAGHKLVSPAKVPPPLKPAKPQLPPRMDSTPIPQAQQAQCQQQCQPLLERVDSAPVTQRKLPPPPPRGADLQKLRQVSFATLSSSVNDAVNDNPLSARAKNMSRIPPPIPHASRPKIPQIPTTSKPQGILPTHANAIQPATSSTVCFKCRDFSAPDAHAAKFPRQSLPSHDLAWLSAQLTSPFPSLTDKARVIFKWLHHNVRYDVESFFQGKSTPQSPDYVFTSGLAVCAGFASLFETLARHAGLEVRLLSGHGAGYAHKTPVPGEPLPSYNLNHAWNVVRIDNGQWKLIDSCWGAGHVEGENMPYIQEFSPKHFTMSNDEFGLCHYPENKSDLYREDGRTDITWEEYISGGLKAQMNIPSDPPTLFSNAVEDHGIGQSTLQPRLKSISIRQVSGRPVHFQFGLICEHWSITKHGGKSAAAFFILGTHGIDGREKKFVPFNHFRGTNPGGGGDYWYLDIPDGRVLGCAGQRLMMYELTSFGDRQNLRGMTIAEFEQGVGRIGMGFNAVAEWSLV
ncbi:uncharacterized protein GIQ15_02696 [Arthroderma uncinatum]|uniref:uncharacterized protein n=1 Tax=Arthroderma uncinatum TaxID=74035 RepID=UPI00144ADEC5|nr:uncharacterized protein GIQ15_02696 [Arthroderma uncinatum]KAF3483372.1 hypothetical protein GIQ15_02696 [Arthroderma uncinatum]